MTADQLHRTWSGRRSLHDHQIAPTRSDWRTWLLLGGRGSGKTFAGAFWVADQACHHVLSFALVGPTLHDVREVMVEGPSGLKALTPEGPRPRWEGCRRRLMWSNGSVAYAFSAEDPDSLRGPQFHHAWADEFCAWRKPETVLQTLRMGLRLGAAPRLVMTTTPRPTPALRRLIAEPGLIAERAPTAANAQHLSPGFLGHLRTLYGGTRLEAQELEGLLVETEGALFRAEDLKRARGARPESSRRWSWRSIPRPAPVGTPVGSWSRDDGKGEPSCWPNGPNAGCRRADGRRRSRPVRRSSARVRSSPRRTRAETWFARCWRRRAALSA